jgi:hypothetical protein
MILNNQENEVNKMTQRFWWFILGFGNLKHVSIEVDP